MILGIIHDWLPRFENTLLDDKDSVKPAKTNPLFGSTTTRTQMQRVKTGVKQALHCFKASQRLETTAVD